MLVVSRYLAANELYDDEIQLSAYPRKFGWIDNGGVKKFINLYK